MTSDVLEIASKAVASTISKLYEYCFLKRLIFNLDKFIIITKNQHGFRKRKFPVGIFVIKAGRLTEWIITCLSGFSHFE